MYIISGREFRHSQELLAFFMVAFGAAYLVSRNRKSARATAVAGTLGLLCFMAGGAWLADWHHEGRQDAHLLQLRQAPAAYVGTVSDFVAQKPGYQNTVLRVEQVQVNGEWWQVKGNVQISVPHDSGKNYEVSYGDRLLIRGAPQTVPPPANPNQFDYRKYLANKNIYHRHSLRLNQFIKIGEAPPNYLKFYSIQLRRKLDGLLRAAIPERREYGIASALVLGVKDDLDNAIRTAYASTGTMHVLAVSGLHVGMIYLLLSWVFGRFRRTGRQRTVGAAAIIAILVLYAFLTGLSPSVQRAVLMFSLVTLAQAMQQKTNSYNTLAIAAFTLLFLNPYNLLEVGFQLSFLAVLGIVYIQPKLFKLLDFDAMQASAAPLNWKTFKESPAQFVKSAMLHLPEKLWQLLTLSVAAQVATFPLGLLYFHQFPSYFWLANLLVVPLAMLVLYVGVAALALCWVPMVGWALFRLHYGLIWCMNEFNLWVGQLPHAIIQGVDVSVLQTWLLFGLLLLLLLFLAYRQLRYLALAVGVVGLLSYQQLQETVQQSRQHRFTVYSLRGTTAFSHVKGREATVVASSALDPAATDFTFHVQPHLWQQGVRQPQFVRLHAPAPTAAYAMLPDSNSVYHWAGLRVLLLSRPLQVKSLEPLQPDYVLLCKNARVVPEDLQQISFRKLILDTSNSPWYLERLKPQLLALGIPFHDVAELGAFVAEVE
ncbi:ComEC/Rec2 family competence protein [Pontibacter sp. 13R65]|uniref:ComEC/Rec2 family competence protein n=1 Tax=Pontibacter sp. 13R65 TaxID=3127458 RepID=UPI00301D4A97